MNYQKTREELGQTYQNIYNPKNCLEALVDAVRNNEAIFNEVASHLKARGYRKIPSFTEIDALMEEARIQP